MFLCVSVFKTQWGFASFSVGILHIVEKLRHLKTLEMWEKYGKS